jgi:hypothetical protein
MGTLDEFTYGWLYTLTGAGLLVGAVGTVLFPEQRGVAFGALIVGPVLFGRGVYLLNRYYSGRPGRRAEPSEPASVVYRRLSETGATFQDVTCEGCGRGYVYTPMRVAWVKAEAAGYAFADAQEVALVASLDRTAVAPCPRCGHIQRSMYRRARAEAPWGPPFYAAFFVLGLSLVLLILVNRAFAPAAPGQPPPGDPTPYRLGAAAVALLGAAMLVAAQVARGRWDPNSLPLETRVRHGRDVALTREEAEMLPRPAGAAERRDE